MKTGIHPDYVESRVTCTCGNTFVTRSTQPEIHVEICSNCHPFYTGRQKLVDTGGRVERFKRRAAKRQPADVATHSPPHDLRAGRTPGRRHARRPEGRPDRRAGGPRGGHDAGRLHVGRRRPQAGRGDRRAVVPARRRCCSKHRLLRLPVVRGAVALFESLGIGFKALGIAANAQLAEDEEELSGKAWTGTIVFALSLSIGLFFLLPAALTNLSGAGEDNGIVFVVVEKLIRISIFLGYLWLISRMKDLQRVFQYHGAEHKTISCYEAGLRRSRPRTRSASRGCTRAAGRASCSS